MSKTAYKCEGDFQMGRIRQHFTTEVVAEDEAGAREAVLANLGSRHSVPRRQIDVQSVTPIDAADANDIIRKKLE